VGLRLIFLIVTRAVSLLGLSRRESWWKDAEILMLRHQLTVAERDHPRAHARLTWPDRAWLALLAGLGVTVAPSTVWQILKRAGIDPAPRRDGPGWPESLRSQAQGILALDFFTTDLLNGTEVYVLAAIEHGTRSVRILGARCPTVSSTWAISGSIGVTAPECARATTEQPRDKTGT
jgi:hypothetical protein